MVLLPTANVLENVSSLRRVDGKFFRVKLDVSLKTVTFSNLKTKLKLLASKLRHDASAYAFWRHGRDDATMV